MSIHKLTAGSGYDYLTRQVAALDATEKGHTGLASYYTERGETPGVWIGSGMDGIDGLTAGDPVTAEQMRAWAVGGPLWRRRRPDGAARIRPPLIGSPPEWDGTTRSTPCPVVRPRVRRSRPASPDLRFGRRRHRSRCRPHCR
ncbi:MAG TPA: relaxase domain-containing protein [Propionibacteriaceae bacterium]|nr:relaxase domain-containing protein [Propionibacteriaceae bacterium]